MRPVTRRPCPGILRRPRLGCGVAAAGAVLAGLMLVVAGARAQAPEASLPQALEQAWARQPQAAAALSRAGEARARVEATTRPTPGPASVSMSHLNDRLNAHRGRREWELEVATPLWLPGQRAARRAEAEAASDELGLRIDALRLQLAGELREAAWALVAAREAHLLAERRLATAQALEDDVMRRYQAGDLARVDANLARTERLGALAEQLESELARRQAEQAWQWLTGGSAPTHLEPESEPASVAASTLEQHPRLAASMASLRLARERVKLADASASEAPELALRAGRERGDASERFANSVGVRLTLPLSFGPRVRQQRHAAQAELDQAQTELDRLREQLAIDAERARAELEAVQRQLALARQRHELGADNLRLAQKSFALGESDLAALLRVRATAWDAEASLARQQTQLARARSRLRQALGVLP